MSELLERVRAATGPDRELDAHIFIALGYKFKMRIGSAYWGHYPNYECYFSHGMKLVDAIEKYPDYVVEAANHMDVPPITGSVDAITKLIERELPAALWNVKKGFGYEAMIWFLERDEQDYPVSSWASQYGAALALCAAFLAATPLSPKVKE